ncbi:DUF5431 family protein [Klebsiella michiganensis]|uniref:DUF5431 family protein n=1 Tax=Klebsiella michiganensis TaxID=1134687 RepID=UPI0029494769|nr:DUF5431 family protein [Klebsiella michiganensis]MDV5449015.1 DUF5431 family protein [Klebsiella michiganensis]
MRLPCAERERFLPADCVTARRNEARCIGAGESRGDYALACFIFRILRRPLDAARQGEEGHETAAKHSARGRINSVSHTADIHLPDPEITL